MISAPIPPLPPDRPNIAAPQRVANIHSCSRSPAWPNGFSRVWGSPVPKPSSEIEKVWTRVNDIAGAPSCATRASVVVAAGGGADARDVGAVDVDRDRRLVAGVAHAVDVAGRREPAHVAGMVL